MNTMSNNTPPNDTAANSGCAASTCSVYFGDTAYPVIASLSGGYHLAAHPNGPCVCGNGYLSTIHLHEEDPIQLRAMKTLAAEKFCEWAWPQLVGQFTSPTATKPKEIRMKKKALWFSRHHPTGAQIEDADNMGYTLEVTPEGTSLGAIDLRDNGDVLACVSGLLGHCADTGAVAIFGVFAAPILAQIARTAEDIRQRGECVEPSGGNGDYPCFAAWNIMRSTEGQKPTFEHRQWLGIGRLNQDSCRWLK